MSQPRPPAAPSPFRPAGPTPPTAPAPRPFPARVGRYQLVREVGRGGMGVVYEATDARLKRTVAIKMIRDIGGSSADDLIARFRTEAEAVALANHPNIVQIYEVGWDDGRPFVALEFLAGGTLLERTAGKPVPPREAAELGRVLAAAVHHAHGVGVIHRDLKPANILFGADGTPKITDFGAARVAAAGAALTQPGDVIGTPQYMAPEQARASPGAAGPAADVYALGAILYHLLTGRPPFDGPDPYDVLRAVVLLDPVPLRRLVPKLPRDLETVVLKCLEKDPARRYPTAAGLADDLARYLAGQPVAAKPAGTLERLRKAAVRRPVETGLVAGMMLVALAGGAGIAWKWRAAVAATADAEANANKARDAEAKAGADRDAARASAAQANADRDAARVATAAAAVNLYAARVAQAAHLIDANAADRAAQVLVQHLPPQDRPAPGPDPRGWEWHHLWRRAVPFQWEARAAPDGLPLNARWAAHVAVSPGGTLAAVAAYNAYQAAPPFDTDLLVVNVADGKIVRAWRAARAARVTAVGWVALGRVVAADAAGAVEFYDPAAAAAPRRLPPAPGPAPVLAAGGALVARAEPAGIAVWDLAGPPTARVLPRAVPGETPAAVSADGRVVATADPAGTVRVYPIAAGPGPAPRAFPGAGPFAALSADGTRLATVRRAAAGTPGRVAVWDTHTGRELAARRPPAGDPVRLEFSPDRRFLLAAHAGDPDAHFWDARANEFFALAGHAGPVEAAAFAPGGRAVATAGTDGTVRVWDPAARREVSRSRGHGRSALAVAFTAGGAGLLSGGADGRVFAWDLTRDDPAAGSRPAASLGGDGQKFAALGFTPAGKLRAATTAGGLFTFDPVTMNPEARGRPPGLEPRDAMDRADFAFGGGVFAGVPPKFPDAVFVWDADRPGPPRVLTGPLVYIKAVAVSRDGRRAAAVGTAPGEPGRGRAVVWDAGTGALVAVRDLPARSVAVAFSPDGTRLAVGRYDDAAGAPGADVWATATGECTHLPVPAAAAGAVLALEFSPAGDRLLAAAGWVGPVVLMWDVAAARVAWLVPADPCTGLAFTPDGSRVATVGQTGGVAVRAAADGAELLALRGPAGRPGDFAFPARVAFSPCGRFLAANHFHGGLTVWDAPPWNYVAEQARADQSAFRFHLAAAADAVRDAAAHAYRIHAAELDRREAPNPFLAAEWGAFAPLADAGFFGPWHPRRPGSR